MRTKNRARKMKSAAALLLALILFALSACSKMPDENTSSSESAQSSAASSESSADSEKSSEPSQESELPSSSEQSGDSNHPESSQSTESSENSESSENPESSENSENSESSESSVPEKGREIAPQIALVGNTEHLYNISSLIEPIEGMSISEVAMQDEDHLLILYKEADMSGEIQANFTIRRVDLRTGSSEILADHVGYPQDWNVFADNFCVFSIISMDPLIVVESQFRAFFFVEEGRTIRVETAEDTLFSSAFSANGSVYFLDNYGSVYKLEKSEGEYRSRQIWDMPVEFRMGSLVELLETQALFSVTPVDSEDGGKVYILIDLESGETLDVYRPDPDIYANVRAGIDGGSICVQESENEGYVISVRYDLKEVRSNFPAGNLFLDTFRETGYVTMAKLPVSGGSLCFSIRNPHRQAEDAVRYFLWDFGRERAQASLEPIHVDYYSGGGETHDLDSMIVDIETRFGVDVKIKDEIPRTIGQYLVIPESDDRQIYRSLQKLKESYAVFPDGFFRQMGENGSPMNIYLARDIRTDDGMSVASPTGLAWSGKGGGLMLISSEFRIGEGIIYHETAHCIHHYLESKGYTSAIIDQFTEYNPSDFQYYYSYRSGISTTEYTPADENAGENYENVYYATEYAKTYLEEDIADLMRSLMGLDAVPDYFRSEHLQNKARYLFGLIRDVYDTEGWPEKTFWEQRIDEVLE